jgi:RNA polymerase sigma factor (sigma-70 family)
MAASSDNLLHYIRRLAVQGEPHESSDASLLGKFLANRDERAFTALVERHGALVLQVCWRILGNIHDAQDAFQATFLVLARKAATVRPPEALPVWLHGVARRVALKNRSARFRKQRLERPLAATTSDPHPDPLRELAVRDYLAIIDEEVRRLAVVYRLPVILCCLEGRSLEEAAQQLGWTTGSVKGRLERGRVRLHDRLVRRGLTLSAALAAAELSRSAAATVAAGLARPLISAAMTFAVQKIPPAAVVSEKVGAIARDFIKSMALAKLRSAVALLLATCFFVGGVLAYRQTNAPRSSDLEAPALSSPSTNPPMLADQADLVEEKDEVGEPTADRIEVSGRVLDPRGRPLAGARLYVGYTHRGRGVVPFDHRPAYPVRAISGTDGRFHFSFGRYDLDEAYLDTSRPVLIAVAEGLGFDWEEIAGPTTTGLNLRLVEDFPLEGRVLDAQRHPVAGAKVFVRQMESDSEAGQARFPNVNSPTFKTCWGPLPEQPPHVTTGTDGRFRLTGLGQDRFVTLLVDGPAMTPREFQQRTRPSAAVAARLMRPDDLSGECVANNPPRSIRGVVRDKTTGQGVAGVKMSISRQLSLAATYTDKDGRYELLALVFPRIPLPREHVILAQPQNGQPYFAAALHVPETAGLDPITADFQLIRGIPLRGRVTDQATGRPPKRAVVDYYPLFPNAHSSVLTKLPDNQAASSATLGEDGSFHLTVFPGPGVVLVAASPCHSYACPRIDPQQLANLFPDRDSQRRRDASRRLAEKVLANVFPNFSLDGAGRDGSAWLYIGDSCSLGGMRFVDSYNALGFIQPAEEAKSLTLDVMVQPARPLLGRVIGPDGQPLSGVMVCGLTSLRSNMDILKTASFVVEGLNPQRTRELSFYHKERNLGKCLTIRGDETKPLLVQLEPCGEAIGRVVDRAGKPVPAVHLSLGSSDRDRAFSVNAVTDHQGRFRAALVPGLPYRIVGPPKLPLQKPAGFMTVESGKTTDLGDLLLDFFNPGE